MNLTREPEFFDYSRSGVRTARYRTEVRGGAPSPPRDKSRGNRTTESDKELQGGKKEIYRKRISVQLFRSSSMNMQSIKELNLDRSCIILMLENGNGHLTDAIGFVAAILTTTAFVPQFIKVWKTRSAKDISMRMYLMLSSGVFLWLIYGIRLRSLPIILANGVTLSLTLAILGLKIKHK